MNAFSFSLSKFALIKRSIHKNTALYFGLLITSILLVTALFGPLLVGDKGLLPTDLELDLASPFKAGRLGRGENGVDVFTSLIHGARVSILVSFGSVSISLFLGLSYGATAGFIGGKIEALAMRIVDVLLAFPGILLAIYVAAVLPPSLFNVILALCATGWVGYARLARAQVLEVKEREFVTAAFALGASRPRILMRHILPNILGPILIQASFGLSTAVLAEASLSFLGIGVPPGTPSWGALLDEGVAHLFVAPHLVVFPGLCIALCVLGFNFLGDGLRDWLDSKNQFKAASH